MAKRLVSDELWELIEPLIPKVPRRVQAVGTFAGGRASPAIAVEIPSGRREATPSAEIVTLHSESGSGHDVWERRLATGRGL
jgi:transposase